MSQEPVGPKFSLSKWVIALLVGIPVAAGAFYLLRKPKNQALPDQNGICKADKKNAPAKTIEPTPEKQEVPVEESPLDRALKLKNAGNAFYKKGEYKEAIRCYTEAISVCPEGEKEHMATLFQNRAAAHELLNDYESVLKDCGSAILLKPDYVKALTRRYKAAERVGHMRQALEDVTAVCLLEKFSNMDTLSAADRILKVIGKVEAEEYMKKRSSVLPSEYFMKQYFASFTQDPVVKDLSKVASAELVLLRGIEKARRALYDERYADIIPACNEEISKPSSNEAKEHALLLKASMNILSSQTADAMADLTYLINTSNDHKIKINALLKRACIYMQSDDERASEDFSEAANLDPNNPDVPHQRAQMFLLGERLENAVSEFHKAAELNPNSGLVQVQKLYAEYRYGTTQQDARMVAKAKAGLHEAINKYPNTPEGYMLLAQVYNDSQEYDKAEATFDAGIKADPKNASILVHKGLLYLQWNGEMDKAITMMEKGIAVDPKCEFAYETLASIEVQRGNLTRAVALFDKALPLAKSEREASHILSLRAAAQAQIVVAKTLGLDSILPSA
uniref:Heat shock protein 70-interacting protein n=1 Tax=Riptortus pedestris TaxID=329032 RepID=R4WU21_RIPPE|nr:heat shock protein 70-interacting protein [Riptortus pedestris]